MQSTSWRSTLRTAVLASTLIGFLASGTTASADFRDASQAALAATVAVEWNEKQVETPGVEVQAPALEANRNYQWLGFGRPAAASFSSGTIVRGDGLIVTFAADPDDANPTVVLPDGQTLPAKRIVLDSRSQLALLKVDAAGLEAISLAEGRPEIGESVLAAMCVDMEDRIVAKGIIAAAERNVDGFPFPLIQTDIHVAPMSAGAPLVNEAGKLLGVIVAMESEAGAKRGTALVVRSEKVQTLLDAMQMNDEVFLEGGYLGISLGSRDGAPLVTSVHEGSPAAHVDIEPEDEIVAIDDQPVSTMSEVVEMIFGKQAGDLVVLELERDGEPFKVRVRLSERPRPEATATQSAESDASRYRVEWAQPSKLYLLDKEGKVQTVDPKSDLQRWYPATQPGENAEYSAEVQKAYARAIEQLAPPQAPVLRVERSELDQKLETLAREVESLRKQVEALTEQLKQLRDQRGED
jgi:S1-C subfamily serine protease